MESNTKTLVIDRVFEAPLERVWQAWTNPEQIKKWWGPKGFSAPQIINDFRVGGKYLYCMHGPAGTDFDKDMWSTGTYKEIIPLQRIVSTDSFADKDGNVVSASYYGMSKDFPLELEVTMTFEKINDAKTKLTLHHTGFPAGEDISAEQGWSETLDKLADVLK
jgi:uncharacterized protein YndB with AHSA1/START domain